MPGKAVPLITGFWSVLLKEAGPVQDHDVPLLLLSINAISSPSHTDSSTALATGICASAIPMDCEPETEAVHPKSSTAPVIT